MSCPRLLHRAHLHTETESKEAWGHPDFSTQVLPPVKFSASSEDLGQRDPPWRCYWVLGIQKEQEIPHKPGLAHMPEGPWTVRPCPEKAPRLVVRNGLLCGVGKKVSLTCPGGHGVAKVIGCPLCDVATDCALGLLAREGSGQDLTYSRHLN
jgi:hypothetical protein